MEASAFRPARLKNAASRVNPACLWCGRKPHPVLNNTPGQVFPSQWYSSRMHPIMKRCSRDGWATGNRLSTLARTRSVACRHEQGAGLERIFTALLEFNRGDYGANQRFGPERTDREFKRVRI